LAAAVVASACAAGSAGQASLHGENTNRAFAETPSFDPGAPSRSSPLNADPLWQRAARGDVIDLTRLADREGSAGLLAGVELGGKIGLTALSALPHAEDGELALGTLCKLAARMPPQGVGSVLVAVEGILGRPVRPTERLDVEGLLECRASLQGLQASTALAPSVRDRAGNARALLEEWLNGR
jgi:hypothetical protein